VQTDSIRSGADSDHDGIPDAWELLHFANLATANGTTDFDHDGFSDLQEYFADTDPARLIAICGSQAIPLGLSECLSRFPGRAGRLAYTRFWSAAILRTPSPGLTLDSGCYYQT